MVCPSKLEEVIQTSPSTWRRSLELVIDSPPGARLSEKQRAILQAFVDIYICFTRASPADQERWDALQQQMQEAVLFSALSPDTPGENWMINFLFTARSVLPVRHLAARKPSASFPHVVSRNIICRHSCGRSLPQRTRTRLVKRGDLGLGRPAGTQNE